MLLFSLRGVLIGGKYLLGIFDAFDLSFQRFGFFSSHIGSCFSFACRFSPKLVMFTVSMRVSVYRLYVVVSNRSILFCYFFTFGHAKW